MGIMPELFECYSLIVELSAVVEGSGAGVKGVPAKTALKPVPKIVGLLVLSSTEVGFSD